MIIMVKFSDLIFGGTMFVTGTDKEKRKKIKEERKKNPHLVFQKKSKGQGLPSWTYAFWFKNEEK